MDLTDEQIKTVGNEVAKSWGSVYVGFEKKSDGIDFICNDWGIEFTVKVTNKELETDYKYCLQ